MRCGWKAVAETGAPRFCCRKLEYGSMRESSRPSRLKTLTVCAEVPLWVRPRRQHVIQEGIMSEKKKEKKRDDDKKKRIEGKHLH